MEHRFIVVSEQESSFAQLNDSLQSIGVAVWLHWNTDVLSQLVGSLGTHIVFIEYSPDNTQRAAELTANLLSVYPRLWVVGFAPRIENSLIIEAMRAGARDFVELQAPREVVRRSVQNILEQAPALPAKSTGDMITLLGARPGVGTTTAAVHLALLLKQEVIPDEPVLLLDFGYPSGDAALYLDTKVSFNFCDAVRSLRRFDHALLNTAFAHHKSGLAILSLPQNLADLRDISPADAMTLLSLFKSYFKVVVVDLGGFAGLDLLMYALGISDRILMVSEQTLPSVFSARQLLHNLRERDFETERIGLLTGKHDPRIEMAPSQIAHNLQIPWIQDLPQRTDKMIACANLGKPLQEVSPKDPYLEVLRGLARSYCRSSSAPAPASAGEDGSFLRRLLTPLRK